MNVLKQINEYFKVKIECRECGSHQIAIDFYEGFIHDQGGDTGSLQIECKTCGEKLDLEG